MVRRLVRYECLEREPFASDHENVGAPAGEYLHIGDLGDAPDPPRRQLPFRHSGHTSEDAEAAGAGAHVGEQLPVARLEEVQWQRRARKEHDAEGEDRKRLAGHAV
jgi:hypothetical protein